MYFTFFSLVFVTQHDYMYRMFQVHHPPFNNKHWRPKNGCSVNIKYYQFAKLKRLIDDLSFKKQITRETLQISSLKKIQYKHMKMCTRIIKNSIRW